MGAWQQMIHNINKNVDPSRREVVVEKSCDHRSRDRPYHVDREEAPKVRPTKELVGQVRPEASGGV